jgi:hypothetical protein
MCGQNRECAEVCTSNLKVTGLDLDQVLCGFILSSCFAHHDRQAHYDQR